MSKNYKSQVGLAGEVLVLADQENVVAKKLFRLRDAKSRVSSPETEPIYCSF
jgi:hypothetical protein